LVQQHAWLLALLTTTTATITAATTECGRQLGGC
jgi:hypothetical protein